MTKQHYIQQAFLKNHSEDGIKIWRLDKGTGEIKKLPISNVAFKNNHMSENIDRNYIRPIEDKVMPYINHIIKHKHLYHTYTNSPMDNVDFRDATAIIMYMTLQAIRTPNSKFIKDMTPKWLSTTISHIANQNDISTDEIQHKIQEMYFITPPKEVMKTSFFEYLLNKFCNEYLPMLNIIENNNVSFVLGDDGVLPQGIDNYSYGCTIFSILHLPITPKILVALCNKQHVETWANSTLKPKPKGIGMKFVADQSYVDMINNETYKYTHRYLYANNKATLEHIYEC